MHNCNPHGALLALIVPLCLSAGDAAALDRPPQSILFSVKSIEAGSAADCSSLNGGALTPGSRVTVSPDGHLSVKGQRVKFFGLNITEIPQKAEAVPYARKLAALGVNILRFHHLDAPWANGLLPGYGKTTRVIDAAALDRLDYFIAALKNEGIYSDLNLLTGRQFSSLDGLPKSVDGVSESKALHALGFFREDAYNLQIEHAKNYLGHRNSYTGLTYAEDPGVALVELNNENGLIMAYLSGWIDMLPPDLLLPLNADWNRWLWSRYATPDEFLNKNALSSPLGPELLVNSSAGKVGSGWNLESHGSSAASLDVKPDKGGAAFTVRVTKPGQESWHVQLNRPGLAVEPGKIYTLSFKARAASPRNLDVSLMMAHDPWAGLGFSQSVKLTPQWQTFQFTVGGVAQADANARVNLGGMGLSVGTVEFSDISFREGGSFLKDEAGLAAKRLPLPSFSEYRSLPLSYKREVMDYLYQKEAAYWSGLGAYLRKDLGVKALLMGTIVGCSPVGIMSGFDIIDSHAYWNHPVFPNKSWDMADYYVNNKSLTRDPSGGTLSSLAVKRVYGKPFSVSEYDHPYPNQYCAEDYPMLASFAAFQDWDMIFGFCLSPETSSGSAVSRIDGYFDQNHNPAKLAALPVAARIFRQGLVSPGKEAVCVNANEELDRAALLKAGAWNLPDGEAFGLSREGALLHRVGIAWDGKDKPAGALAASQAAAEIEAAKEAAVNGAPFQSDTREISWYPNLGYYRVGSAQAYVSAGFAVSPAYGAGADCPLIFSSSGKFSVVAGANLSAKLGASGKWLLFSCAGAGNVGEGLREYGQPAGKTLTWPVPEGIRLTTKSSLGTGPAWGIGSEGSLSAAQSARLFPLAPNGLPLEGKEIHAANGAFPLSPADGALWYEMDWAQP
jgi:hypothetical protein